VLAAVIALNLSQGRRGEARAMLAAIYNWFTEGFDTCPSSKLNPRRFIGGLAGPPIGGFYGKAAKRDLGRAKRCI
jgi:hypothetical protein